MIAQPANEYIKHTVLAGENITQISKKYKITPYDIYILNPEAKNGINENDILLIQLSNYKVEVKETKKEKKEREKIEVGASESYEVKTKDTKYSLSKKFNISIEELEKLNPEIKDGLKNGQLLILKESKKVVKNASKNEVTSQETYIIQPEDTKFSISKKFNVSIEQLEEINPQIKNGFPIGKEITIPSAKKQLNQTNLVYKAYTILPKETLYGISKKFNVSQMEIIKLNPVLKDGFKEGLTINIPNENLEKIEKASDKTKLVFKKSEIEKTLVLLLPFNLPLVESDSIKSKTEFLRSKDGKLTNYALDYYSGAIIAIDSAKRLGYNIKVKIIDFESTKKGNNLNSILEKNDFSRVNAIIGPFINSQVEQTAIELEKYKIPIVSPLSSSYGKPYANIFYAMPSDELKREVLFDYFKKNNGNVLAIFSNKKKENKETLLAQFPDLKIVPTSERGGVTSESIISLLDSTKKNFVILDTEKTGLILNSTGILGGLKSKYDIQLVVFELYDALDFEEISIKRFTNLKMMYPSINKNNDTGYYKSFVRKYKSTNGINPNQYATRGFDVTLDTILRMYQENGFANSTTGLMSEQLESKFNYRKIESGNYNTGIYLLQYTDNLTIEEAK
jgi:LysM repeat protein